MSAVLDALKATPILSAIEGYWRLMKPREKRLTLIAAILVFLPVLWWLALAPAIKTLHQAPEQHRKLDAQIYAMQVMSSEAKGLHSQPKLSLDESQAALLSSVMQRFGSTAQLNMSGDRATLTLRNASPQELAQWLTQARVNARAVPIEVKLSRSVNDTTGKVGWNGNLVLGLPKK